LDSRDQARWLLAPGPTWRGRCPTSPANGHDWTEHFPLIVEALNALKATTCLIDGEAIAPKPAPLRFEVMRNGRADVHLCALELLELDGRDVRLEPLANRRGLLARFVRKPRSGLVLNTQFEPDGPLVFEHACLLGCEGIVSKRKDSRYPSGRSRDWVKSKNPAALKPKPKKIGARRLGLTAGAAVGRPPCMSIVTLRDRRLVASMLF
jgi:bifunctional non-homologous end joining protein LigD